MSKKIGIVALTPSSSAITLYLDTGATMRLPSSSYRTREIVDEVLPIIALKKVAYVDLDSYSLTDTLHQKTNGALRFFRRIKNTLKSAVGLGSSADIEALSERARRVMEQNQVSRETEINHPNELSADETMVVVVDGQEIEGVERLASQMEAAAAGNAKGLENFLKRLAKVAKDRKHTADELLNFMKKGDLPIADDGSIIAYKVLKTRETEVNGVKFDFVDPHSERVSQKVGTRVEMPIGNVDDSRRLLCSNGLHVARRDYIRGFHGNAIALIRVAPEDVIAVPENEPSKMRAMGYDILARIPDEGVRLLRSNQPMTSCPECALLLGAAISGDLPEPDTLVEVIEEMGKKLRVTVKGEEQKPKAPKQEAKPVLALPTEKEDVRATVEGLDARSIASAAAAAMSGDLAAALSVDPDDKPDVETPKARPMPPGVVKDQARLDAEAEALRMVKAGASKREAERKTGVSARAIGRLLSK